MASYTGTSGNDTLTGTVADDRFSGSAGSDRIAGGGGYDALDYSALGTTVSFVLATATGGFAGNTVTKAGLGTDSFRDIDAVYGSTGADRMEVTATALAGNIFLFGYTGADILVGRGQPRVYADYYARGESPVRADLAAGTAVNEGATDTLTGIVSVRGSLGDDTLLGSSADNRIIPMAGMDVVDGRGGTDTLFITSTASATVRATAEGAGTVQTTYSGGWAGTTTYISMEIVVTGDGADTFLGSAGHDRFAPSGGSDRVDGGAGFDMVLYNWWAGAAPTQGIRADLSSGTIIDFSGATDTVFGIEGVAGSPLGDILIGDGGANLLLGGEGDDTLIGGAGNDTLQGDEGSDFHDGGAGYDTINLSGTARRSGRFAMEADGDVTFTRGGTVDTYRNQEVMVFADGRMVFDPADPAAQVVRLYQAALGRTPDQKGLNDWITKIEQGAPLSSLATGFIASKEFAARYGAGLSTGDFIERLYLNALGRPSDPGGKADWTKWIDTGTFTRAEALARVSESAENKARTDAIVKAGIWDVSEDAAFVARLYDTSFGRAPDLDGLRSWREVLEEGTQTIPRIVQGFINSQEFATRYGAAVDTGTFVELLYVNALRRPSDPAGKANWVKSIDAGVISRTDAVLGFSESAEHKAFTAPAIFNENPDHFGILFV